MSPLFLSMDCVVSYSRYKAYDSSKYGGVKGRKEIKEESFLFGGGNGLGWEENHSILMQKLLSPNKGSLLWKMNATVKLSISHREDLQRSL